MYFKSDTHKFLYKKILQRLSLRKPNNRCASFTYLVASTEKLDIINAFSPYEIDTEMINNLSQKWTSKNKQLLEYGFQILEGSKLNHLSEAEQALICCILLEPEKLPSVSDKVLSDDFYRTNHQQIFDTIISMSNSGDTVDLISVTFALHDAGILEEIGGIPYLNDLASTVTTTVNIDNYAKIVVEKAPLRRIIQSATEILTSSFSSEATIIMSPRP
ncbi:DnaB-like helicase N-terminal domain-containing protein [Terribacillus sp. JSM ZJ617]|uniref:DnaB-like helicase N-terminal domain-containing protein n=1 Tax=Terribacillus sp. JSM ZJ617 TaxID=3342119 RepID=UPI0035A84059